MAGTSVNLHIRMENRHILSPGFLVWNAHADLMVEPSSSSESSVQGIWPIRRTDDDHWLVIVLLPRHVYIDLSLCARKRIYETHHPCKSKTVRLSVSPSPAARFLASV